VNLKATSTDGRSVVELHDDHGEPFSDVSNGVDIKGQSQFQDILNLPLTPDRSLPKQRPALVKGQILVAAQISFTVGAVVYVLADVRVLGYCGSQPTIIAAFELGGSRSTYRVPFGDVDTFDRVVIQARFVVNGVPTSDTTDVTQAIVSTVVDMYTGG
jgi:hypothetical protein